MSNLHATAVSRAIDLLNAAGAKYAILHGDAKYGDLEITPPKPKKTIRFSHAEKHDYIRLLEAANTRWGYGATITEFRQGNGMKVSALVVHK